MRSFDKMSDIIKLVCLRDFKRDFKTFLKIEFTFEILIILIYFIYLVYLTCMSLHNLTLIISLSIKRTNLDLNS